MKDFDDIFKQRLEGYEMKLPTMDQQSFWDRKAVRERAARRRRNILTAAVGLPAVAAVLMAIMMTINLLSRNNATPPENPELTIVQQQSDKPDTDNTVQWITIDIDGDLGETMENAQLSESPGEEDVFMVVDESPEFPGGTNALMGYLRDNMVIPDSCWENNIQGRVLVTFIVEKDGSITKPVVVKSVNHLLDAEALRLVSAMPKWKPGRQNGQAQRVKFTIPINFRLDYYKNRTKATATESAVEDIMSSTKDKTF